MDSSQRIKERDAGIVFICNAEHNPLPCQVKHRLTFQ
jgi:hypothetical protein